MSPTMTSRASSAGLRASSETRASISQPSPWDGTNRAARRSPWFRSTAMRRRRSWPRPANSRASTRRPPCASDPAAGFKRGPYGRPRWQAVLTFRTLRGHKAFRRGALAAGPDEQAHARRDRPTTSAERLQAKFLQAEPNPDQAGPRKWAWIFLDSFVRFGAFQWVTGGPNQKNAAPKLESVGAGAS